MKIMAPAMIENNGRQERGRKGEGGLRTSVAYSSVVLIRPTLVQFCEKHSSASAGP